MVKTLFGCNLKTYRQVLDYGKLKQFLKKSAESEAMEMLLADKNISDKIATNRKEEIDFHLFRVDLFHRTSGNLIMQFENQITADMDFISASAAELALFEVPWQKQIVNPHSGLRIIALDKNFLFESPKKLTVRHAKLGNSRPSFYFRSLIETKRKHCPTFILVRPETSRIILPTPKNQEEVKHEAMTEKRWQNHKGFTSARASTGGFPMHG